MTSNDKKAPNRHSRAVTEGDNRAPNRAMLRAVGFGDDDFSKPIGAIANGQSDITPCNVGLGDLALAAAGATDLNPILVDSPEDPECSERTRAFLAERARARRGETT